MNELYQTRNWGSNRQIDRRAGRLPKKNTSLHEGRMRDRQTAFKFVLFIL